MTLLIIWTALPLAVFLVLLKAKAPYGRYLQTKGYILINNRVGWVIMELPALVSFDLFFILEKPSNVISWILFFCWTGHYFYRSLIFPFRLTQGRMPVTIVILGFGVNVINGYFIGHYLGITEYPLAWFYDPRFLLGIGLFFLGLGINRSADRVLLHLKRQLKGYQIPQGGMYKFISVPNYFGEIIQWIGFAVMAWCLPALAFALWTMANLIPRAIHLHRWYQDQFADYPKNRKAIIPYIL